MVQTTSTIEMDSVTTGELPPSPPREAQPPQRTAAPPSPGKPLRLQAGREVKEAGKLLKWALMQQKNAESKYATECRVHEAKCKLLEAKKITGSTAERMEGAYDLLNGVSKQTGGTCWPSQLCMRPSSMQPLHGFPSRRRRLHCLSCRLRGSSACSVCGGSVGDPNLDFASSRVHVHPRQ